MTQHRRAIGGILAVLGLLLAGVILPACSSGGESPVTQSGNTAGDTASLSRTDEGQGGVTVKATWVTPFHLEDMPEEVVIAHPPDRYLLVHLTLDTHSGDLLAYDLASLVALRGRSDRGPLYPEAWLGLEESGHHRDGVLAFAGTTNERWGTDEGSATLTVAQIAGAPERMFTWEFPSSGT